MLTPMLGFNGNPVLDPTGSLPVVAESPKPNAHWSLVPGSKTENNGTLSFSPNQVTLTISSLPNLGIALCSAQLFVICPAGTPNVSVELEALGYLTQVTGHITTSGLVGGGNHFTVTDTNPTLSTALTYYRCRFAFDFFVYNFTGAPLSGVSRLTFSYS